MAAKTLVEKIQEDIVGTKDEVKEEEKKEGDTEMEETKEEVDEESKKGKRSRKGSAANKTGAAKDNKKKKSEPSSEEVVTPASERPTRERKTVERYSEPSPGRSVIKGFTIGKGRGTQLKDIPKDSRASSCLDICY